MDIVITTIFPPTAGTVEISRQLAARPGTLWVVGDRKGPFRYDLPHVRFYDIDHQAKLPFRLASLLPEKHYTRKNLGYLLAIESGAKVLVETDDDNIPLPGYWEDRHSILKTIRVAKNGWHNVYRDFSDQHIWPRGFPLEEIHSRSEPVKSDLIETECLIQQGLANQNPDVDAVYRLTLPLPIDFREQNPVSLESGCWCPFNSQNTTFFEAAFPLLYLPTFCTFRMTDIWRSFVAQRCLWAADSRVAFTQATVFQERNEHNLLKDLEDEFPGYLKNGLIRNILESTTLQSSRDGTIISNNLLLCYEALVRAGIVPAQELKLAAAWTEDLDLLLRKKPLEAVRH